MHAKESDGAVHLSWGLINLAGGHCGEPSSRDPRSAYVDFYATIRGAVYPISVRLARAVQPDVYEVSVPNEYEHIAHPVYVAERWNVLVAAENVDAPALGLGVHNWFLVGGTRRDLLKYQSLVRFVQNFVEEQVKVKGDELARLVMGSRVTWASANRNFYRLVHPDDVWGPSRLLPNDEGGTKL